MNARCFRALALFSVLLLLGLLARGQEEAPTRQLPEPRSSAAVTGVFFEGGEIPARVTATPEGPLFAVEPIARRLGRAVERGAGYTLTIDDTRVIFGPGSAALTRGTEILTLSQPPIESEDGLLVPLDFFRLTFGDLLGHRFAWDETARRLDIERPQAREVGVEVDLVHLQGVTTVVLRFSEPPRYRLVERPGTVVVELAGGRFERSTWQRREVDDPWVRSVEVTPGRILLELDARAAAESYTLERPFRLVFDVHRGEEETAAAPPVTVRPPKRRAGIHTIVVDPGHGGEDTGAVSADGLVEKDLTLTLARTLERRLESELPVRVVLTRTEDVELPLDARTAIANQNKGDLFISLHLNSAPGGQAHGAETYFLSRQASDERAARAAAFENRAAAGGPAAAADGDDPLYDLQLILWDLAQTHHLAESQQLARLIQEELNGALKLRDRGVKQAPFRVLMGAAMPAVLVELGFLSNPREEQELQDPVYRGQLVDALVRAISSYRAQVEQAEEREAEDAAEAGRREENRR